MTDGIGHALAEAIGEGRGGRELRTALHRLESGRRTLDWIHLGKCDVTIRDLIRVLRNSGVAPPRTGHLGDWSDIAAGRSGLLDYNRTICRVFKAGSPLLFDTTSTETSALDDGDVIYLPGSTVERGVARELPLLVHTASGLRPAARTRSWFGPFVIVRADDELRLLSECHRTRNARLDLPLDYVSRRLMKDEKRLHELITTALCAAEEHSRGKVLLASLFAGLVGTDGAPRTGTVAFTEKHYAVDDALLSRKELADRLLLPFQVLNRDAARQRHLDGPPPAVVPTLSNLFLTLLMTQMRTHVIGPDAPSPDVDVHPHWGAIGMAGFPPRKRGYFEGSEYPRRMRPFFDHAVAHAGVPPTLFVVAPSVVFTLLPRRSDATDIHLVTELCQRVRNAGTRPADRAAVETRRTVTEWFHRRGDALSAFYRSQFNGKRTISGQSPPPEDPEVVACDAFLDLTCRQASMTVGALHELNTL